MRNGSKVISDFIVTTKDTIFILQQWLALLEQRQGEGQVETEEFEILSQQVREAGLGPWLERASGYDLAALSQVVNEAAQSQAFEWTE